MLSYCSTSAAASLAYPSVPLMAKPVMVLTLQPGQVDAANHRPSPHILSSMARRPRGRYRWHSSGRHRFAHCTRNIVAMAQTEQILLI
jgi:hypothetical protein